MSGLDLRTWGIAETERTLCGLDRTDIMWTRTELTLCGPDRTDIMWTRSDIMWTRTDVMWTGAGLHRQADQGEDAGQGGRDHLVALS